MILSTLFPLPDFDERTRRREQRRITFELLIWAVVMVIPPYTSVEQMIHGTIIYLILNYVFWCARCWSYARA